MQRNKIVDALLQKKTTIYIMYIVRKLETFFLALYNIQVFVMVYKQRMLHLWKEMKMYLFYDIQEIILKKKTSQCSCTSSASVHLPQEII